MLVLDREEVISAMRILSRARPSGTTDPNRSYHGMYLASSDEDCVLRMTNGSIGIQVGMVSNTGGLTGSYIVPIKLIEGALELTDDDNVLQFTSPQPAFMNIRGYNPETNEETASLDMFEVGNGATFEHNLFNTSCSSYVRDIIPDQFRTALLFALGGTTSGATQTPILEHILISVNEEGTVELVSCFARGKIMYALRVVTFKGELHGEPFQALLHRDIAKKLKSTLRSAPDTPEVVLCHDKRQGYSLTVCKQFPVEFAWESANDQKQPRDFPAWQVMLKSTPSDLRERRTPSDLLIKAVRGCLTFSDKNNIVLEPQEDSLTVSAKSKKKVSRKIAVTGAPNAFRTPATVKGDILKSALADITVKYDTYGMGCPLVGVSQEDYGKQGGMIFIRPVEPVSLVSAFLALTAVV